MRGEWLCLWSKRYIQLMRSKHPQPTAAAVAGSTADKAPRHTVGNTFFRWKDEVLVVNILDKPADNLTSWEVPVVMS